MAWRYVYLLVDAAGAVLCNGRVSVRPCVRLYAPWHVVVCIGDDEPAPAQSSVAADSWQRWVKLAFIVKTSLTLIYAVVSCFTVRVSTSPPAVHADVGQRNACSFIDA